MLKIIGHELYKVISKRGLLIVILLILNCLLQYVSLNINDIDKPDNDVYNQLFKTIEHMSMDEKQEYISSRFDFVEALFYYQFSPGQELTAEAQSALKDNNYLEYTDSIIKEYYVLSYFYNDIYTVINYDEYLNDIKKQGESMIKVSLFVEEDSFSYRNINKTMEDYERLKGIEPSYDVSMGVKTVTQFIPTDIIIAAIVIIACFMLISHEKDKNLFELLRTMPNGRIRLIVSKLLSLFIITFLTTWLIYSLNLTIGHASFGLGDLSRPLQSVTGFSSSPFKTNVGNYLVLFFLMKLVIFLTLAVIIFTITIIVHNSFYVYATIASLLGIKTVMFLLIEPSSPLSPLKYINIIPFIKTDMLFYEYININFFSIPINIIPCFIIYIIIVTMAGILFSVYTFANHKIKNKSTSVYKFKSGSTVNLFLHESWKMLFAYKTVLLILVILIGYFWLVGQNKNYPDIDELHYRAYMEELSGEFTANKDKQIIEEREKFTDFMMGAGKLNRQEEWYLQKLNAFERVEQSNLYIKTYMGQHSGIPWFIYDKGYNILTAKEDNKEDLKLALVYMVLLIICVSSIMSIEYGSKPIDIVKACYHGRIRLLNTKLFIALISALLLYLAVYIPQYININKFYDFDNLNAPLYSLVQFKYYNGGISILHYLIMLNITKIIGAFVAVLIILTLSRRSMINTMLFSSIALLLPIVFSLVGLNFCEFIPTVALSCGNVALKNYSPIYGACALVIIGGLYIILANRVVKIGNLVKVHLKARSN